jgi:hypothetical protein
MLPVANLPWPQLNTPQRNHALHPPHRISPRRPERLNIANNLKWLTGSSFWEAAGEDQLVAQSFTFPVCTGA